MDLSRSIRAITSKSKRSELDGCTSMMHLRKTALMKDQHSLHRVEFFALEETDINSPRHVRTGCFSVTQVDHRAWENFVFNYCRFLAIHRDTALVSMGVILPFSHSEAGLVTGNNISSFRSDRRLLANIRRSVYPWNYWHKSCRPRESICRSAHLPVVNMDDAKEYVSPARLLYPIMSIERIG